MSGGYVKLYGSITRSSVWGEDSDTRVVWITMLAEADSRGCVMASVGGLARIANVSREACERALAIFQSPDPDDRSGVDEGRRIRVVPGGWQLVNYLAYRELRTEKQLADAERQARSRANRTRRTDEPAGDARDESQADSSARDTCDMSHMSHDVAPEEEEAASASALRATAALTRAGAREVVAAANRGLEEHENPRARQLTPIRWDVRAEEAVDELVRLAPGIPTYFAVAAMYEAARSHTSATRVSTIRYFVARVAERWQDHVATEDRDQAATPPPLRTTPASTRPARGGKRNAGEATYDNARAALEGL